MTTTWERRQLTVSELRAPAGSGRMIEGYAIRFNRLSEDLGGFRERIMPSAVDRTLRQMIDVRAYVNHNSSMVLGRRSAGTLALHKDQDGLRVEIDPPDTTAARDLVTSIRRGDITGMSFAFRVQPGGESWRDEGGVPIREIRDMVISEVSVVSQPAYTDTSVAMRSLAASGRGRQARAGGPSFVASLAMRLRRAHARHPLPGFRRAMQDLEVAEARRRRREMGQ